MTAPTVSIVINTYNRAHCLEKALKAASDQAYPHFEIVVVNGPSTDGTADLLGRWASRVKVQICPEANLSMSRNIGIEAAAGEIVAFMDDDAAPHPNWLSRLTAVYGDPTIGGAGGFTLDASGGRFQVRKTICDRAGSAYYVSPFFDERALNFPKTPFYPSLLGANSSFRRAALAQIGGFDHAFAYLLDETDVCLRLVDAGWKIVYVQDALVQHQFEESHLRDARRVAKSLYPSAASKAYFVLRHGRRAGIEDAARELNAYRDELLRSNSELEKAGLIDETHRFSLDQDVTHGLRDGAARCNMRAPDAKGDLRVQGLTPPEDFLPVARPANRLRIAFVSQGFPPSNDAGIARWTQTLAQGLAQRGHAVHVVTRSPDAPSMRFEDGVWVHRVAADPNKGECLALDSDLPASLCAWAAAARSEIERIKAFGLDVVSHPIWDLEGVAMLGDPDVALALSLHTTYALAKPFKPEWNARPLYEHFFVNRVIAAERRMLASAPVMLANSRAIVRDIAATYDVDLGERAKFAPHGAADPFLADPKRRSLRNRPGNPFLAVYVGRFEPRKGFDIAVKAMSDLLAAMPSARVVFAGGELDVAARDVLPEEGVERLERDARVRFVGVLSRDQLDDLYCEAHVVLAPSRYESFGLVAIEAMAAGAPVIALDVGGSAEVIEAGISGSLVAAGPKAARECAAQLVRLARDAPARAKMSDAARAAYERSYSIDAMAAAAEEAYRSAVALRKAARS